LKGAVVLRQPHNSQLRRIVMSISITRKRAYSILAALALALAISGYARWLTLTPASWPASAAPAQAAPPRIELSKYNLPAQPEFYSERDDNYMLGSYGG
jgi:hypothetical protein